MSVTFTLTFAQRQCLMGHLFPGDGLEAMAIGLCGRAASPAQHRLLLREIHLVPYDACERASDRVKWPTSFLVPILERAEKTNSAIVKIHGHYGFNSFSATDDHSDQALFPRIYDWMGADDPHGSVIVLDDGRLIARAVLKTGEFAAMGKVSVIGDEVEVFSQAHLPSVVPAFGQRVAQVFGAKTFEELRRLRIGVVGCSGTGSVVIEQLARNGVGQFVLVDPDVIEEKNLNRILNSTMKDVAAGTNKVDVALRSIASLGMDTQVEAYSRDLFHPSIVSALSACDFVFGCMDSIDGRYFLNKLAVFYLLPYIDVGVKIEADGQGGVDQVAATVHYLKPDGSSLLSRRVFSLDQVKAAGLFRSNRIQYRDLLDQGYIRGVAEDRPAVIHLNSLAASLAVNEFLARIHSFRIDSNREYASTRVSLTHGIFSHEEDDAPCPVLSRHLGRGDVVPPLDWAELTVSSSTAQ